MHTDLNAIPLWIVSHILWPWAVFQEMHLSEDEWDKLGWWVFFRFNCLTLYSLLKLRQQCALPAAHPCSLRETHQVLGATTPWSPSSQIQANRTCSSGSTAWAEVWWEHSCGWQSLAPHHSLPSCKQLNSLSAKRISAKFLMNYFLIVSSVAHPVLLELISPHCKPERTGIYKKDVDRPLGTVLL